MVQNYGKRNRNRNSDYPVLKQIIASPTSVRHNTGFGSCSSTGWSCWELGAGRMEEGGGRREEGESVYDIRVRRKAPIFEIDFLSTTIMS